jgi:acyl dehydratase
LAQHDPLWPRPLSTVLGPYRTAKVEGAALGMGECGPASVSLFRSGILPPDMMSGLTLYLIARQPREKSASATTKSQETRGKTGAPGVSGGIWVREQAVFHRPIASDDAFTVTGRQTGRHVRKGRRYADTESTTHDSKGQLTSNNRTTGLMSYRVDESLEDAVEGKACSEMKPLLPDWTTAAENPHLDALAEARVGDILGGQSLVVTLAMMAARDTDNPDNPIHSDPDSARAAGLKKPIAGGSHVQSFALEGLMARFGPQILLHGAYIDCRWKMPTEAGDAITPRAEIVDVQADFVEVKIEVTHEKGPTAMTGSVTIPRPPRSSKPS